PAKFKPPRTPERGEHAQAGVSRHPTTDELTPLHHEIRLDSWFPLPFWPDFRAGLLAVRCAARCASGAPSHPIAGWHGHRVLRPRWTARSARLPDRPHT